MAAAAAQISSSLCCYSSSAEISAVSAAKTASSARFRRKFGTAFAVGTPLLIERRCSHRSSEKKSKSLSIRSEESSQEGNGLGVWLGRLAMVGFASVVTVEFTTGKGLLETLGLISPLPTPVLVVTVLVGVLASIFIFQSASEN